MDEKGVPTYYLAGAEGAGGDSQSTPTDIEMLRKRAGSPPFSGCGGLAIVDEDGLSSETLRDRKCQRRRRVDAAAQKNEGLRRERSICRSALRQHTSIYAFLKSVVKDTHELIRFIYRLSWRRTVGMPAKTIERLRPAGGRISSDLPCLCRRSTENLVPDLLPVPKQP
jgi:hypothetical protein